MAEGWEGGENKDALSLRGEKKLAQFRTKENKKKKKKKTQKKTPKNPKTNKPPPPTLKKKKQKEEWHQPTGLESEGP